MPANSLARLQRITLVSIFLIFLPFFEGGLIATALAVPMLLVAFKPTLRSGVFIFSNILFLLFGFSVGWMPVDLQFERLGLIDPILIFGFKFFVVGVVLIVFYKFLCAVAAQSIFRKYSLIMLMIGYVLLLVFLQVFRNVSYLYLFTSAIFIFYGKSIWFLAFLILEVRRKGRISKADFLMSLNPFYLSGFLPIPGNLHDWKGKCLDESFISTQISGLKLILFLLPLGFLKMTLLKYGNQHQISDAILTYLITDFNVIGNVALANNFYVDSQLGLVDRWIIVTCGFLTYLLDLSLVTGLIVAKARMMGLPIFRNTYKVASAKTLYEMFLRVHYYYNEIIVHLLVGPSLRLLWFVNNSRVRVSLAFFLAILSLGWMYHYIKWPSIIISIGPWQFFIQYLEYWPYFFGLATAASISIAIEDSARISTPLVRLLKLAIYFLIYSILFALIGSDYVVIPGKDHLKFVLSLFGS